MSSDWECFCCNPLCKKTKEIWSLVNFLRVGILLDQARSRCAPGGCSLSIKGLDLMVCRNYGSKFGKVKLKHLGIFCFFPYSGFEDWDASKGIWISEMRSHILYGIDDI